MMAIKKAGAKFVEVKATVAKQRGWRILSFVLDSTTFDRIANSHTVSYDGALVAIWIDNTFMEPGKVGVWTKADSVTAFDQFTYGAQ